MYQKLNNSCLSSEDDAVELQQHQNSTKPHKLPSEELITT
ncbi:hypothetical protein COO91_05051 [Nostoc flagelliforme CCNUN1]|uniref:Uncharacterized protein n=1 Tax=Nostoc flagelliforme CCNUN1 TaxID=2038116 RepID=A0A2K8SUR2_9NOSO|nr:hypothetical protein COO91_05051 [Nostoc flagelliforme CCNUN1]